MDRLSGVVVFFVGVLILWQGRSLSAGSLHAPGPGFFPKLLAVTIIVLSIFLIIPKAKKDQGIQSLSYWLNWKVAFVFAALIGYFLFLDTLGFVITSFLLMIFLFIGIDSHKWYKALLEAVLTIGLVYLLFQILLKSNLPQGVFGF